MADTDRQLMRREDIEATRRPFAEASPLAGPPYRDPQIFGAELERISVCVTPLGTRMARVRMNNTRNGTTTGNPENE